MRFWFQENTLFILSMIEISVTILIITFRGKKLLNDFLNVLTVIETQWIHSFSIFRRLRTIAADQYFDRNLSRPVHSSVT